MAPQGAIAENSFSVAARIQHPYDANFSFVLAKHILRDKYARCDNKFSTIALSFYHDPTKSKTIDISTIYFISGIKLKIT